MGEKFIPLDHPFVEDSIPQALQQFRTSLAWAQVFGYSTSNTRISRFKGRSSVQPPPLNSTVSIYYDRLESGLSQAAAHLRKSDSYFVRLISAFRCWLMNHDVVARAADKNLGLVLLPAQIYRDLCLEYIATNAFVVSLPASQIIAKSIDLLKRWRTRHIGIHISDNVANFILKDATSTKSIPYLYGLPKLHKFPVTIRPIVAAHSDVFSNASRWLSAVLQPIVENQPAYLKDTRSLVSTLLHLSVPSTCVFLVFDVTSMYPSLKKSTALQSIRWALDSAFPNRKPAWTHAALTLVEPLFTRGYFDFDNKIYLQKDGVVMGTPAAVQISNLYLSPIEAQIVNLPGVYLYKRYIDDGLCIVDSIEIALEIQRLLGQSDLTFTWSLHLERAVFLDLEIFKHINLAATHRLAFRTYRKALNRFLYIPAFSAHNPSTIVSWIYAEILRLRNTCSFDTDFKHSLEFFLSCLWKRGYKRSIIQKAFLMLPVPLLSPLIHKVPLNKRATLPTELGDLFKAPPPKIFRAPYSCGLGFAYGPLVHQGFDDLVTYLDQQRGARDSNPYPFPHPKIIIANINAPNLLNRISNAKFPRKIT